MTDEIREKIVHHRAQIRFKKRLAKLEEIAKRLTTEQYDQLSDAMNRVLESTTFIKNMGD